jgi:O-antigen/teichoic acid export membrane protein
VRGAPRRHHDDLARRRPQRPTQVVIGGQWHRVGRLTPAEVNGAAMIDDVLDSSTAAGRAIRGAALRTAGHVLGVILSLVAVPFMIRHLGVVDYGYYITVSSIIVLIQGFTEAGLTNLGVREFAVLGGERRDALLRNLLGLRIALTAVGVVAFTAIAAVTGAKSIIVIGTVISGIGLLFAVTQQSHAVALTGTLRLGWVTVMDLIRQASLSAVILLLVALHAGLVTFFWANVLATGLMMAATLALLHRERLLGPAFDLSTWKMMVRETLPFALAVATATLYTRVAIILMSYVASDIQTGLYSAALRIADVTTMVPALLVSSTFPILARAAHGDPGRLAYGLQRQFEIAAVVGAWMALCVGIAAPFAVAVVAGDNFTGSVPVLQILAGGLVTGFLVGTSLLALLSLKRYREIVAVNAAAAVVAIAATIVLAPSHGAVGGAIATVGAEAVLALACLLTLARSPVTRPNLAVVPKVVAAVGAGLVPALIVPAHPLVLVVLATLCYAAVAFMLGAVPRDAIDALRRRP